MLNLEIGYNGGARVFNLNYIFVDILSQIGILSDLVEESMKLCKSFSIEREREIELFGISLSITDYLLHLVYVNCVLCCRQCSQL